MKSASLNSLSTNAISVLVLLVLGLGLFTHGINEGSPQAEYRELVMEAVGAHMEASVAIVRKEVELSDHLTSHADALASLAVVSADIFPKGSEGGDALPAIWQKPQDFKAKLQAFEDSAGAFKSAVDANDSEVIRAKLRDLGQSCRSCHRSYRKK